MKTLYGGSHKHFTNQRLEGAARRFQRKRQTFVPNSGPHSSFLISTFGRKSQLPNPVYMATIEPSSLKSTAEEVNDAVSMWNYTYRTGSHKPEVLQTTLYRILLAGLKPYYTLPAAQKGSRGPDSWA